MLVLRIFGALLVVTLGLSMVMLVITKDRRWGRFAVQALKLGLILALIFMALYAFERLALIV